MLLARLQATLELQIMEAQCSFRKGRGRVDQRWLSCQLVEVSRVPDPCALCFVDLAKVYHSMDFKTLVTTPKSYRVPNQLVAICCNLVLLQNIR